MRLTFSIRANGIDSGYRRLFRLCDFALVSQQTLGTLLLQFLTLTRYVGMTLNLVIFIVALGVWPASYVLGGEASSLRLRARSQGIGWTVGSLANFVFSTVTPYIYNADSGNLRSRVGFVWAGLCAITFGAAWYLIPEMLGRTPLQLDLMFEEKLPAKKFRDWQGESIELMIVGTKQSRE